LLLEKNENGNQELYGNVGKIAGDTVYCIQPLEFKIIATTKNPMVKSELINNLITRFPYLKLTDCEASVSLIFLAMSEAMERGHRIEIRGIGSFTVTDRKPRNGRNPRNGTDVAIPGRRVVHFKPGKKLREAVATELPTDSESP
jgi:integration host factor subunit beta